MRTIISNHINQTSRNLLRGALLFILSFSLGIVNLQAQCATGFAESCLNFSSGYSFVPNDFQASCQSGNDAGYVVFNVTTGGTLNANINGDATSGFIDVGVFQIPPGGSPCDASNIELSCNFAPASGGCASFGWTGTPACSSNSGGLNVLACERIMIVAENFSGTSSTFEVYVDNTDGDGGHVGPPETDIPDAASCTSAGAFQIPDNTDVAGTNAIDGGVDIPGALPAETGGNDADNCPNAGGGTWIDVSGSGALSATGMFDPSVSGAGTFYVEYQQYMMGAANGCFSTDQSQITVDADPDASFTCPPTLCADGAAVALAPVDNNAAAAVNGAATGAWSGSGAAFVTGDMFDPAAAGPGTYMLTYTYTSVNGICDDSFSCTFEVEQAADPTTTGGTFCPADTPELTATCAAGTTVEWFSDAAGTMSVGSGATFNPPDNTTGTYTYYAQCVSAAGCGSALVAAMFAIGEDPIPAFTCPTDGIGQCSGLFDCMFTDANGNTAVAMGTIGGSAAAFVDANGMFDPLLAPVGVPLTLTYTLTDPVTGCTATTAGCTFTVSSGKIAESGGF